MLYQVLTIKNAGELYSCPEFSIDQFNWGGDYRPVSRGRLGFLPAKGLLLQMECEESNPCRKYTNDGDPVYLDSAMEAFFCFCPENETPCYLNFEMNSNGAMLACYGNDRKNRIPFPEELRKGLDCQASIRENIWKINLFIPLSLLKAIYPGLSLHSGSTFTCNFYKIKESEGQTHFASFAPIPTREPNFHMPEYFARACILPL